MRDENILDSSREDPKTPVMVRASRRPRRDWPGRRAKLVLVTMGVGAIIVVSVTAKPYSIPTGAMEPSVLIGDRILAHRLDRPWSKNDRTSLQRGDIIAFRFPPDPRREFLKRVIALPGERIRIDHGTVFVDDKKLVEPYIHLPAVIDAAEVRLDNFPEVTVPGGHYFVLGDNRDNSHDSRAWGFLPADLVTGRALFVYWSYDAPRYSSGNGRERLKARLDTLVHFTSRTRWTRLLHSLSAR